MSYKRKAERFDSEDKPRLALDVLTDLIAGIKADATAWPEKMPLEPIDAAKWWIRVVEPAKEYERPQKQAKKFGDGTYWKTPYADRLVYTARKFIKSQVKDQNTILACREDGVFWRGDEIPDFMTIYDETLKAREEGIVSYRGKVFMRFKRVIAQMG